MLSMLAFIDGIAFDPFFRGLLSVLVGVVVMVGGTYLLVATNSGSRVGGLISGAAFFGWMAMMGVIWTVYAIGWTGEAESWALVEINGDNPALENDGLAFAENEDVASLGLALEGVDIEAEGVSSDDPDVAQAEAVAFNKANRDRFDDWRYLATSNPRRGEAVASADVFLAEEHVFDSTAEYVPLRYGAYNIGGKPLLKDDPNVFDRVIHKLDTTFVHFWHPQELVVIQVQGALDQPILPGEAPPVATADDNKSVVTVVMERDRGGPLPALFGGTRVTPALFAIFNGILFFIFCWSLHVRDKREMEIRAAVA